MLPPPPCAGLVYKHYGREIVASAMALPADSPEVEAVYLAVYKNFMESIDAIDNGGRPALLFRILSSMA